MKNNCDTAEDLYPLANGLYHELVQREVTLAENYATLLKVASNETARGTSGLIVAELKKLSAGLDQILEASKFPLGDILRQKVVDTTAGIKDLLASRYEQTRR